MQVWQTNLHVTRIMKNHPVLIWFWKTIRVLFKILVLYRQAYQIFIRWSLLLWKEPLGKSKLSPSITTFFTMTLSGSFYKISFHRICKVIVMTIAKSFLFLAKTFLTGLLHENHSLFINKALSESTMVKTKRSDLLEYKGPSD